MIIIKLILFSDIITSYIKSTEVIIGLLSSIGSIVVAIATIITVQEMKKSRIGSVKPDLFIASKIIIVKEEEFHNYDFFSDQYKFEIINLGNGPGKHLKISWINDLESRIQKLNSIHRIEPPIQITKSYTNFNFKNVNFFFNELDKKETNNINYVLSGGEKNANFFIGQKLLKYIILESLIYAHHHNSKDIGFLNIDNNNSKLEVEYTDTLGYEKIILFKINIKLTIFKKDDLSVESIMLNFDFESI